MMAMQVDVHIGMWTKGATRVNAFDHAQLGQHLHIFVHTLEVAANSPRQFTHRQHALLQQGCDQGSAAFGQPHVFARFLHAIALCCTQANTISR